MPTDGETFVDWYSRNKSALETENPDLTPSELTRHSMRKFKELKTKYPENGQKRKLDDEADESPVTNAPKQSKLSAFAFSKKT